MRKIKLLFPLFLLITAWSCELENPEIGVDTRQIIQLSLVNGESEILANGQDRLTLEATLGPLADANLDVTFSTEKGRFAEADPSNGDIYQVTASNKTATATLISDTEVANEVVVTVKVSNFVADTIISFTRAYPKFMTLTADKNTITADRIDFAQITFQLSRDSGEGLPSTDARIDLEIVPLDTATASIVPFVFTTGQTATATIKSANGKPGKIQLIARTESSDGTTIETIEVFDFED